MAKKYHDGAVSGNRRIADIALTVLLAALCVVWMYPVILILINSLKDELAISTATVFEFPTAQTFAGLHNYVHGRYIALEMAEVTRVIYQPHIEQHSRISTTDEMVIIAE